MIFVCMCWYIIACHGSRSQAKCHLVASEGLGLILLLSFFTGLFNWINRESQTVLLLLKVTTE